jgi:hypothetical protein
LAITLPPKPAVRIFRPSRSFGVFSSLRNQPNIWPPVWPAGIATTPKLS